MSNHSYMSNHEASPQGNTKDPQFRLDVHTGNQKGTQPSKLHHHENDQESIHGGIHWNPESSLYVHRDIRDRYRSDYHELPRQGNKKDPQFRLDVHTGKQKNTQPSKVHYHETDQESIHGGIHWNPQSSLYVHRNIRGPDLLFRSDNHERLPPQGNSKDVRTGNHKNIDAVAQQLAALQRLYLHKPKNIHANGNAQQFAALVGGRNQEDRQPGLCLHKANHKHLQAATVLPKRIT